MKNIMIIIILIGIVFLNLTIPKNLSADQIFKWIDEEGNISIVDDIEKLPEKYKKIEKNRTPIIIARNNTMYVPVLITYQRNSVNIYLVIDTGCSGISISPAIANRLGMNQENNESGTSITADGTIIPTTIAIANSIKVGPKTLKHAKISIMPRKDNIETGLLGMGFLKYFPHTINTKARVIIWT